jgi:hypothetical protein
VVARLGSSLSSMTKAASKTAGSGLGALSLASVLAFPERERAPGSALREPEPEADLARVPDSE